MDETEKAQQDSLETPAPDGEVGTTPEAETRTYTQAEVEKLILDTKAKWGREVKPIREEAETLKSQIAQSSTQLKDAETELEAVRRRLDEVELERAKGNPDQLDLYNEKKRLRELERNLETDRREIKKQRLQLDADLQEVTRYKKGQKVAEIAAQHGLTAEDLAEFKDLESSQVEIIAKKLSSQTKPKSTPQLTARPASGVTKGSASYTIEQLDKMSPEEYARVPEHLRDAALGR